MAFPVQLCDLPLNCFGDSGVIITDELSFLVKFIGFHEAFIHSNLKVFLIDDLEGDLLYALGADNFWVKMMLRLKSSFRSRQEHLRSACQGKQKEAYEKRVTQVVLKFLPLTSPA